jgi:hypothetical protein
VSREYLWVERLVVVGGWSVEFVVEVVVEVDVVVEVVVGFVVVRRLGMSWWYPTVLQEPPGSVYR